MNSAPHEFITFRPGFGLENKSKAESLITRRPGAGLLKLSDSGFQDSAFYLNSRTSSL